MARSEKQKLSAIQKSKRSRGQRGDKPRPALDQVARAKFIATLRVTPNAAYAAACTGVPKATFYSLRERDPAFAAAWDAALDFAVGDLEAEARRRAGVGYRKPIYQQGRLVGHETVYSDVLMGKMLEAHHPAYKSKHEISGPGGAAIALKVDREGLAAKLDKLGDALAQVEKKARDA